MKRFKEFLIEKGAGQVGTEHYDVHEFVFGYENIGSGMPYLPIYGKRQERIQGKIKKMIAYHVADAWGIKGLKDLAGGSKSGSFFTKSTGNILTGAVGSGGVLVQVEERPVLRCGQYIYSEVDRQGRRWVSASYCFDDQGDDMEEDLKKHMDKFVAKIHKRNPEANIPSIYSMEYDAAEPPWFERIQTRDIDMKLVSALIKEYFDWTEKYVTKHWKEIAKNLLKEEMTSHDYDEILMDQVEVKNVWLYASDNPGEPWEETINVIEKNWKEAKKILKITPKLLYDEKSIPFQTEYDVKKTSKSVSEILTFGMPDKDELHNLHIRLGLKKGDEIIIAPPPEPEAEPEPDTSVGMFEISQKTRMDCFVGMRMCWPVHLKIMEDKVFSSQLDPHPAGRFERLKGETPFGTKHNLTWEIAQLFRMPDERDYDAVRNGDMAMYDSKPGVLLDKDQVPIMPGHRIFDTVASQVRFNPDSSEVAKGYKQMVSGGDVAFFPLDEEFIRKLSYIKAICWLSSVGGIRSRSGIAIWEQFEDHIEALYGTDSEMFKRLKDTFG